MEGNYNEFTDRATARWNYTLERDGRELQLAARKFVELEDYTLERDGRELQQRTCPIVYVNNYTLERDGRELQHRLTPSCV